MKELPFTVKERAVVCRTTPEGAAVYRSGGRAFELRCFFLGSERGVLVPGLAYEELDSRQTDRQTDGEGETCIASVRDREVF